MDKIAPWLIIILLTGLVTTYLDTRDLKKEIADHEKLHEKLPSEADMRVLEAKVTTLDTSTGAGIKRIEDRIDKLFDLLINP